MNNLKLNYVFCFFILFFSLSSFAKTTKHILNNMSYKNDNFYSINIKSKEDKHKTTVSNVFSGKILSVTQCKKNKQKQNICNVKIKEIKKKKNKTKVYTKLIKGFHMAALPKKIKTGDSFSKKKYVRNNKVIHYQYCLNNQCFNKKNRYKS